MNYSGGLLRQHTTLAVHSSTHTHPSPYRPHTEYWKRHPSRVERQVGSRPTFRTRNSTSIFQNRDVRIRKAVESPPMEFYSRFLVCFSFSLSAVRKPLRVSDFGSVHISPRALSESRNRITRVPKMCRRSWLFFVAGFAARDKWL